MHFLREADFQLPTGSVQSRKLLISFSKTKKNIYERKIWWWVVRGVRQIVVYFICSNSNSCGSFVLGLGVINYILNTYLELYNYVYLESGYHGTGCA